MLKPTGTPLPAHAPRLATLVDKTSDGDGGLHEIKYDGYRMGAHIQDGMARLVSRSGQDWTGAYPEVVAALSKVPVRATLLDGEVAVLMPDGRTGFQALQDVGARGRPARIRSSTLRSTCCTWMAETSRSCRSKSASRRSNGSSRGTATPAFGSRSNSRAAGLACDCGLRKRLKTGQVGTVNEMRDARAREAPAAPYPNVDLARSVLMDWVKEEPVPDNRTDRGPADRSRINVNEEWELRYWTEQLNVGEEQLRAAVAAAGTSVEKVREHLRHSKQ